jgi:hypothetical protein
MYVGLQVKYHLLLSDFSEIWNFLVDFLKILKYQISIETLMFPLRYVLYNLIH